MSLKSHPAWDAWIEITKGRTAHVCVWDRRIPHGMRGLKSADTLNDLINAITSHPAWDAWIEIKLGTDKLTATL